MISSDNPINDDSVPPTPESAIRAPNFRSAGQAIGDGLSDSNFIEKILDRAQKLIADAVADVLLYVLPRIVKIVGYIASILVKVREGMDENIAKLASLGLSELFSQEENSAAFAQIGDSANRKQIAQVLGSQVLRGIVGDNSGKPGDGVTPSDIPAKDFLTRMAELTVEGWFESVVTGLASEHPLEKIGDLKEQVARTFSFGRISHRVLAPVIDAAVVAPFKHKVEKDYRPKLLSEATAVEMFLRGKWTRDQLNEELARQGYADSRIDSLINEKEKFLGSGEVAFNWLSGTWSHEEAVQYLQEHGYSTGIAGLILAHEKQRQIQDARKAALTAATDSYVHRFIDVTEFTKFVEAVYVDEDIRHEIITSAAARRELNRSHVSEQRAETAVIDGFWTIQQYTDHLVRLGYSDDDILTMQLLVQEKIKETSDKTSAKKAAAEARAAAQKAKTAAAQERQAQLEKQRSHRDLTLAQVHRAYVQGRLSLGQLQSFLVEQKQAPEDIDTLLTLAQAEHNDYQAAQAKKARATEKLAITQLSTAQLEHLVKTGGITIDDYQAILTKEGVSDSDVSLLVKAANIDLQTAIAAKAHREAVAARLAEKGLSLAQMEEAVRRGLRTMDEFRAWLTANKYSAADQASLMGLLQDRIAADQAATEKKKEHEAKLAHKGITLAELERAVEDGLRPMADYQQALIDNGVNVHDVQTLVGLLQRKIDDMAALAKRKAEAALKAASKSITLPEIERAARLGILSESYYRQALQKAGMPAEDQDVLVHVLEADIARVQLAREKEAQAKSKLEHKPVSLGVLKHGVLIGLKTIDDYKLTLKGEGFDQAAVDLMGSVLADEVAQAKVSAARKAALDAKRSVREIARADFEKAVAAGLKTIDDYAAFLKEQGYDEEDLGILVDLLRPKVGG